VLVLAWFHGEKGEQRAGGMEISMLAALLIVAATGVLLVSRSSDAAPVPPAGATASEPATATA
jgi:hypothetical protein